MFYGREELLGQLGDLLKKRTASLVTCRGRRRIGKSTLVEEFARRNRLKEVPETRRTFAPRVRYERQAAGGVFPPAWCNRRTPGETGGELV